MAEPTNTTPGITNPGIPSAGSQSSAQTPPAPPPDGGGKVTFTSEQQELLNKMFAERGKQGAQSREAELLKEFGVEKWDDIKAAIAEAEKARKAQMSDLEKAQTTAQEWEKKHAQQLEQTQELESQLQEFKLRAAIQKGIKKAKLEFASEEAEDDAYDHLLRIVSFDDSGDVKGLDEALKALKEKRMYLFTQVPPVKPPRTNAMSGGGLGDDAKAQQAEIARRFNLKRVPRV